eukprot:gene6636-4755_t
MLAPGLRALSSLRPLSAASLLHTIRGDPGMTSQYYANRYFGPDRLREVDHLAWQELKKHGKVTLDRIDGPEAPPRWVPIFQNPRRHHVQRHNPEDEDLSVLQRPVATESATGDSLWGADLGTTPDSAAERDDVILRLVAETPEQDIQCYVSALPEEMRAGAPLAFRRLREAGVLRRSQTPLGTFAWSCA